MNRLVIMFCVVMLPGIFHTHNSPAQDVTDKVVIGQTIQLDSKILGEKRDVHVSLPDGYEGSQQRYPVLYLLDGETHFRHGSGVTQFLASVGRSSPMIVVAIPNTDRPRDLTPMHVEYRPTSGGAEKFLSFIQNELFPEIAQRYRTTSQRILAGHSLGGMFTAYTLLTRPEMFQIYIAIAPGEPAIVEGGAVGGRYLLDFAAKTPEKNPRLKGLLLITSGGRETESQIRYATDLANIISKKATQTLDVNYTIMPDEDHMSIVHRALYNGLESAYTKLQPPMSVAEKGAEAVEKYYQELSSRFDYDSSQRERWINLAGYQLLQRGKSAQAIDIFKLNVKLFPQSANVYDSLGEAFERSGQFALARENYRQACAIAEKEHNPALATFKANFERMEKNAAQSH